MKRFSIPFLLCVLLLLACEGPNTVGESGLHGRVFANAGPGFYEMKAVATIVVLSEQFAVVGEHSTDSLGRFRIPLPTGVYFLDVKESPDVYRSGPFSVSSGTFVEAKAYHYNSLIF